jgi:carbonic anhydrase
MCSLRSLRLVLSIGLCNLGLVACGAETPDPRLPVQPPTQSSAEAESAAWIDMRMDAREPERSAEAAVVAHLAGLRGPARWSYEGDSGPDRWADLSSGFVVCGSGSMQSPIDISPARVPSDPSLELIDFGYASIPLWIMNDGRVVQIANSTPAAINAASDTWRLREIQLHSPSEHSFDGKRSELEIQMLHVNDRGRLAVVSLLFRAGEKNEVLAPVFDALDGRITEDVELVPGASLDIAALVSPASGYFTYLGSLTTPGCAEDVRWFVLPPSGSVSTAQIEKLRSVTVPSSARPIQPLGGRQILRPR